jgi:NADH dehydrogenase
MNDIPFRYRDMGSLVSLATYNGWGTFGRHTFGGGWLRGLSARLGHDLLYRQHQFEMCGPSAPR